MTASGRDKPDAPDDRSFAELIADQGGIVPIPARHALRRESAPRAGKTIPAPAKIRQPLQRSSADDPLVAHRSFVRLKRLRELRAGAIRPDRSVDLHGCDRRRARQRVQDEIRQASRAGERCVLVVVGRGRHSTGGVAVLRDALPKWLSDPALEQFVAAFAPAIASDGGRGALYVLLG
jgi:DNA-nicking Smr family endonuclease